MISHAAILIKQFELVYVNNIVIFAPHPDDETLGCGGLIAKRVMEGCSVFVVFMTDGRYALTPMGITSDPSPLEMKEIRKREALRALGILGIRNKDAFFLDFEDTMLKKYKMEVYRRIVHILKDINPSEVFFPQRKEYHIDHQITNMIVEEAVRNSKLNVIKYQYIIAWKFPFNLFAHILNERSFDKLMSSLLKCNLFYMDISDFLHIKTMAIKEYKWTLLPLRRKSPFKFSSLSRFIKSEEKFFF